MFIRSLGLTSNRKMIPYALKLFCAVLFLWAGVHKIWSPAEAVIGLQAVGIPRGLSEFGVLSISTLEVYLGIMLLLVKTPRRLIIASQFLLLMFSFYLLFLVSLADAPSCGCFGFSGIFESSRNAAAFGVLRNFLMIAALFTSLKFANNYADQTAI